MRLRVWMSAPDAPDMDVFVAVQKLDAYGDLTGFPFYAVFEDGPVALGWLRASHRELDQEHRYPRPLIQAWHEDSVNRGPHVIYAGGEYDSHLLVPVSG